MTNDPFIDDVEAFYERIINVETDDFLELCKIADLDITTDFKGVNLTGITVDNETKQKLIECGAIFDASD